MKRPTILALAAACVIGAGALAAPTDPTAAGAANDRSILETVSLLRWGYGALDWLNPHTTGEPHERQRTRR